MLQKHFCGEGSHRSLSYKKFFFASSPHTFLFCKMKAMLTCGRRLQVVAVASGAERVQCSGDISQPKPFLRLYCPLSDISLALSHIVCNWKSWWRTRKCMIICFPWDFWNCQWVQLCGVYNLSLRDGLYQRPDMQSKHLVKIWQTQIEIVNIRSFFRTGVQIFSLNIALHI